MLSPMDENITFSVSSCPGPGAPVAPVFLLENYSAPQLITLTISDRILSCKQQKSMMDFSIRTMIFIGITIISIPALVPRHCARLGGKRFICLISFYP